MKKTTAGVVAVILCWVGAASADYRVWTDQKGNTIEAQYIQMSGNKVVMETPQGKRVMVPKEGLCAKDLEYLASVVPPTFDIVVKLDLDRNKKATGYYYETKQETLSFNIAIKKTNKEKCSRRFKAKIYVLAAQKGGSNRQVIDYTEHGFSVEKQNETSFTSVSTTRSTTGYSYNDGYEYEGYIVCIEDDQGTVIAVKTNKNTYETNLHSLKKTKKGSLLNKSFIAI